MATSMRYNLLILIDYFGIENLDTAYTIHKNLYRKATSEQYYQ